MPRVTRPSPALFIGASLALTALLLFTTAWPRTPEVVHPEPVKAGRPMHPEVTLLSEPGAVAAEREVRAVSAPEVRSDASAAQEPSRQSDAPRLTPFRLNVIDSETDAPLNGLKLVRPSGWLPRGARIPDVLFERDYLRRDATSPLEITPSSNRFPLRTPRKTVFLVHRDGYAWTRCELEIMPGGEATIELETAGAAVLQIVGLVIQPNAWLRLRRVEQGIESLWIDQRLDDRDRVGLDGLLPGQYRASIEVGPDHEGPEVLGSTEFTVESEAVHEVMLELEAPPVVTSALLAGCVTIPAAWQIDHFELSIRAVELDDGSKSNPITIDRGLMLADPNRVDSWHWTAGALVTGRYELMLLPLGHRRQIRLGPEGLQNLCLIHPSPGRVRIRVVEPSTGQPRQVAGIRWEQQAGHGSGVVKPTHGEVASVFEFDVPVGYLRFSVADDDWAGAEQHRGIVSGLTDVVLGVRRACDLRVVLMDGNRAISRGMGMTPPRALGHSGRVRRMQNHPDGFLRYSFDAPGPYELEIQVPVGYRPIPTQKIEVEAGRTLERVIDLVR